MSIVEVAKLAGCSHTTVSRVINQKPGVSAEVTGRVQAAMQKLRYVPPVKRRGPVPKNSRSARTGNVAVLMFGTNATPLASPVSAAAIHAVEDELGNHGYSMSLGQVAEQSDGAVRLPSVVTRGDIDGLILHGKPPRREQAAVLQRFPAVWIMSPRSPSGYWGDRVCPDNAAIGRSAAEYLINRGHERIGFLYVDAAHLGFPARAAAFVQAANDAGIASDVIRCPDEPAPTSGDFRALRRYIDSVIDRYMELPDRPSGLFVPRGQTTLMVFEALRSRGVEPGTGVTLIACDNDPVLGGLSPQIATLDVQPNHIGRCAVDQLMQRMQKPEPFARADILVQPLLVEPTALGH